MTSIALMVAGHQMWHWLVLLAVISSFMLIIYYRVKGPKDKRR